MTTDWTEDFQAQVALGEELDLPPEVEALEDGGNEIRLMLYRAGFRPDPIKKGRWSRVDLPS